MPRPIDELIDETEQQLAKLRHLKETQGGPWPKRCKLYVHGSKESNYETGANIGLTGEALEKFIYTTYEILLEYDVQETGDTTLRAVDGRTLED